MKRLLFESMFKNAGVGIALVNKESIAIRINAKLCMLLGYTEEEIVRESFKKFAHPEDVDKDSELFSQLLSGSINCYEIEKRYIRKDGRIFWGLLTSSIVRMADGSVLVIRVVQDIDARKKAEEALVQSEERLRQHNIYKDKIFSLIAHDLKGPVSSTVSMLEILEKNSDSFSKEQMIEFISKLRRNTSKTLEMLNNLLSWSQSQFMEIKMEPVTLSLTEEIERVTEQLQQQATLKGCTINVLVPENLKVHADQQMLQVILRNLLSNAIKFSKPGKTITIDALKVSSIVHISIIDEGVGLSSENIARLLNKKNIEGITSHGTKGEKGTGIGIKLSIDYIERHGGNLQISSELDKWSKFTFTIPAADC